jgi:ABC-2 type transport system permease protein
MRVGNFSPPMFLVDISGIAWNAVVAAVAMIAIVSTFLGLFIAVSVREIFEAQTFSNFFRFPVIFLCGLFFPIDMLPVFLQPLSYIVPLTYGVDILHGAIHAANTMPFALDFVIIGIFCIALFFISARNIHRKWIV